MGIVNQHIQSLVDACFPTSPEEASRIWHDIKPVRFGNRLQWANSASRQILAAYQVPDDAGYLVILRVECYTYTETATAPGFRNFEPPPAGNLQWFVNSGAGPEEYTALVPTHILADVDEYLVFKAGVGVSLEGVLNAPPDANARFIRTLVYGYVLSAHVADQLGSGEIVVFGANT